MRGRKRKREDRPHELPSSWHSDVQSQDLDADGSDSTDTSETLAQPAVDGSSFEEDAVGTLMLDEGVQQRKAALSKLLDQQPTDWRAWIALVELQDEVDGFQDSRSQSSRTNAERRSNAEVDLSIYHKALKNVVDLDGRERLCFGMMSKAPVVWERSRLLLRWKTILEEHPFSLRLWKKYLDFHQSTSLGFRLEETRKQYIDGLDILQKVRERVNLSPVQHSKIYILQVYLLLRLSLLLKEGGYSEVAVAMWQALLEFEFNRPHHLCNLNQGQKGKSTYSQSVSDFENFWESDVPRIGEPDAKGWSNFHDDQTEQPRLPKDVEAPFQVGGNALKAWVDAERRAEGCSLTAIRTLDESSDDPYRIVLFSDIKSALIESPTTSDRHIVLAAFLCVCHLPPSLDGFSRQTETWFCDQFIQNQTLCDKQRSTECWLGRSNGMAPDNRDSHIGLGHASDSPSFSAFEFPMAQYQVSSDTLFPASGQWFSVVGPWAKSSGLVPEAYALRTLQMLVSRGAAGDGLTEYVLALELQVSRATVRKFARSLLKKWPSSLRLYNAYALIEYHLGNTEAANKVLDTAIGMSAKLDKAAKKGAIMLWRSRIWQQLSAGETSVALQRLMTFGFDRTVGESAETGGTMSGATTSTTSLRLRNVSPYTLQLNTPTWR